MIFLQLSDILIAIIKIFSAVFEIFKDILM